MNVNAVEMGRAITASPPVIAVPRQDHSRENQSEVTVAVSNDQVRQMVAEMQSQIERMNVSLQYSTYGERGEKIAVIVADKETGEVIREIPARELQNLYAKMSEIAGIIFNRQV